MAADACSTFESALLLWTQQSLQHHLYSNATFLAERLHAHAPSEESAHVLATCHFSSGDKVRAYHLLQGCVAAHNRYLLALCCLELGHLNEAERVLLGPSPAGTAGGAHAGPADPLSVPNGAAGLHLLGTVCLKSQRREQAARYFAQALELNPYLWSAYEALCQLGIEPPPLTVAASADLVPPMRWPASERRAPRADGAGAFERAAGAAAPPPPPPRAAPPVSAHLGPATPGVGPSPVGSYGAGGLFGSGARAPAAFTPMSVGAAAAAGGLGALSPLPAIAASLAGTVAGESLWAQPSPTPAFGAAARGGADGGADGGGSGGGGFGGAPARSRRALGGAGVPGASGSWLFPSAAAADGAPLGANAAGSAARRLPATGGGGVGARAGGAPPSAVLSSAAPVRRSSRLSGGGAPPFELPSASAAGGAATAEGLMGDGADARARDAAADAADDDDADELCGGGAEGACPAALLLRQLACALHRLCTYRCADALALLHRLPRSQARTGWVLCQIGRAHFESVNYPEVRRTQPRGRRERAWAAAQPRARPQPTRASSLPA
jgi:anaphase-promoting complex subunit 3